MSTSIHSMCIGYLQFQGWRWQWQAGAQQLGFSSSHYRCNGEGFPLVVLNNVNSMLQGGFPPSLR